MLLNGDFLLEEGLLMQLSGICKYGRVKLTEIDCSFLYVFAIDPNIVRDPGTKKTAKDALTFYPYQ